MILDRGLLFWAILYIPQSLTHGQCDARPAVTFLIAERSSLAGTEFHCSLIMRVGGLPRTVLCMAVGEITRLFVPLTIRTTDYSYHVLTIRTMEHLYSLFFRSFCV